MNGGTVNIEGVSLDLYQASHLMDCGRRRWLKWWSRLLLELTRDVFDVVNEEDSMLRHSLELL
jgi:hypothetical protein